MKSPLTPLCNHRVVGIDAKIVIRGEDGYAARCLLCETIGPVKTDPHTARLALLPDERTRRVEDEPYSALQDN